MKYIGKYTYYRKDIDDRQYVKERITSIEYIKNIDNTYTIYLYILYL
jgi:hypothetical protein